MMNNSYKILLIFTILLQSCWGDKGAPNYEYMPNMYESLSYEAYSENQIFDDELSAATCLPALYIDGISVVKNGAWPCALPGVYGADNDEIKKYSIAAKTQKGFEDYMKNYLSN